MVPTTGARRSLGDGQRDGPGIPIRIPNEKWVANQSRSNENLRLHGGQQHVIEARQTSLFRS